MSYVPNPFKARLAEQQRDVGQFVRTFGAGMLDVLPEDELWNRLLVIRSAPGAGKTSILRMLTPSSLEAVARSRDDYGELFTRLTRLGAIHDSSPQVLGTLVSVGRDYRSLTDLGPSGEAGKKVFFKLLDARILSRFIEAIATVSSSSSDVTDQPATIEFKLDTEGISAANAIGVLNGDSPNVIVSARALLARAQSDEREILQLLDSLLPVEWDQTSGHANLYAMRLLGHSDILVNGSRISAKAVVLFDDVHDLSAEQREQLSVELLDRTIACGRWIAERTSAQADDEVLSNATSVGRDRRVVLLEDAMTRNGRGSRTKSLQRLFGEIANARAVGPLRLLDTSEPFTELLDQSVPVASPKSSDKAISVEEASERQKNRLGQLLTTYPHFESSWTHTQSSASSFSSYEQLVRYREFEILAMRDLAKGQVPLFPDDVEETPADQSASDTREAARLFVSVEHKLPYYFGASTMSDLGSRNVEQYLDLAGEMFDIMVSSATINRSPAISAWEQDRQVRVASKRLWASLVQRVPHGEDVVALLHAIAFFCRGETFRNTAPYAPGATGVAISAVEMERLLQQTTTQGAFSVLARTVANAVAFNLLEMQRVTSKGEQVVVLYLNRLLCPHFDLTLRRGGFREQSLTRLAQWIEVASAAAGTTVIPDPSMPLDGIGRGIEIGAL